MEKISSKESDTLLTSRIIGKKKHLFAAFFLSCFMVQSSYADFINGRFEDPYIPSSTNTFNPITGWTLTGYTFLGTTTPIPPHSISEIPLSSPVIPGGITDIIQGPTQTLFDWFLEGATPTPTMLLPLSGLQTVMVNLRSVNQTFTVSGTDNKPVGWTLIPSQATSISQQITVQSSDIDPLDGKVHIRFKAAPVLENPAHIPENQPFFAIQLNNLTTGRTGANPLYFRWDYANQPGVSWQSLSTPGTNSGSSLDYLYTDQQAYDISPGNAFLHVGDVIELIVLASGCSQTGHDGHIYVDDVQTSLPPGLWVSASGPLSSSPGANITYTYTYTNNGTTVVNGVQVIANMPEQGNPPSLPAESTTFVSVTTPTAGVSPSCSGTDPVICNMGALQPGERGTFQLTVNIPSTWSTTSGPVNNGNYPISGQGVSPLLGPLIQTALFLPSELSNLVVDISGIPTTGSVGVPYSGTFSCSNTVTASATGDALLASCDMSNLPPGLSVSGCTISPFNAVWVQPATIPASQTVRCNVIGTPTTTGVFIANLVSDAINNLNSTTNHANQTITISSNPSPPPSSVLIPATLNGVPIYSPAKVGCGRPIFLGELSVPGPGLSHYFVINQTGHVNCLISQSRSQTFLKISGCQGSCTIIGTKNGIRSEPFTVIAG